MNLSTFAGCVLCIATIVASIARAEVDVDAQAKTIAAATATLAGQPDGAAASRALVDRGWAYRRLKRDAEAIADADEALRRVGELSEPKATLEWPQAYYLRAEARCAAGEWASAMDDYLAARAGTRFDEATPDKAALSYNLSRAAAHANHAALSEANASQAMREAAPDQAPRGKLIVGLALRQRAVARYDLGNLDDAIADWNAAKAAGVRLGEPPFEPEQAAINRAADRGSWLDRVARAEFLLGKADDLERLRNVAVGIGLRGRDLPTSRFGTISRLDTTGTSADEATPLMLDDDALVDVDCAIARDLGGEADGMFYFSAAIARAKARAMRYRLEPTVGRLTLEQVDADFDRAVSLRPLDLPARQARGEWLCERLANLNGTADEDDPIATREATRAALLLNARDDLSRLLLADPDDASVRVDRARLALEQPAETIAGTTLVGATGETDSTWVDAHAVSIDLAAAEANWAKLTPEALAWVTAQQAAPAKTAAATTKPAGTALERKLEGNAAIAKHETLRALVAYDAALRIDPTYADALCNRGIVYSIQQQWDLALTDLDAAIARVPAHRVALLQRATVRRELGQFDVAIDDGRASLAAATGDGPRRASGEVLVDCIAARAAERAAAKDAAAAAADDFGEANAFAAMLGLPADADRLRDEGIAAAHANRGPQALAALRAAHAAAPKESLAFGWLTIVAAARGEPDAATLERDLIDLCDAPTLRQIDEASIDCSERLRLSDRPDDEARRTQALHERLSRAWRL